MAFRVDDCIRELKKWHEKLDEATREIKWWTEELAEAQKRAAANKDD